MQIPDFYDVCERNLSFLDSSSHLFIDSKDPNKLGFEAISYFVHRNGMNPTLHESRGNEMYQHESCPIMEWNRSHESRGN